MKAEVLYVLTPRVGTAGVTLLLSLDAHPVRLELQTWVQPTEVKEKIIKLLKRND